jgi:ubiquinone biosynthesis protein
MAFYPPFQRRYQELVRARHITEVLVRNGLGFLVEQLGLSRFLPAWGRRGIFGPSEEVARRSIPERLRNTFEELGPTYIKLGQVLSTRVDLLPPEYIAELSKLLDTANPVDSEAIAAQVERELGQKLEECFAEFSPSPVASASIGQVHRARLLSGEPAMVKVQRPGAEATVQADLDLLMGQASFLQRHSRLARDYQIAEIIEELAYTLQCELDYTFEGRNADHLRHNLRGDSDARIPHVYWNLTTRRVITMEALEGLRLTNHDGLVEAGYDLPAVAQMFVELYLKQVFRDGFFHADPHPANILLCGQQIGLVDFGMVGHLTPLLIGKLGDLLLGLLEQDAQALTRVLLRMGAVDWRMDTAPLERDLHRLITRYYGLSLEQVPLAEMLQQVLSTAFRHRVRLPAGLASLARMVIVLEGVALKLDPSFVLVDLAKPFAQQLIRERFSPQRLGTDLFHLAQEGSRLAQDLPRHAETLLGQLESGGMTIGIALRQLEDVIGKLDRVANRLAFSVIVAAIVIASSLLILGGTQAAVWRLPLVGWGLPVAQLGFLVAGLMGMWLLFSIVRSRGL